MSTPAFRLPNAELANGEATSWIPVAPRQITALLGPEAPLCVWMAEHGGHLFEAEIGAQAGIRQIVCVRCLAAEKRVALTASLITAREAPEPPARLRSLRRVGLLDDGTDERDATGQA